MDFTSCLELRVSVSSAIIDNLQLLIGLDSFLLHSGYFPSGQSIPNFNIGCNCRVATGFCPSHQVSLVLMGIYQDLSVFLQKKKQLPIRELNCTMQVYLHSAVQRVWMSAASDTGRHGSYLRANFPQISAGGSVASCQAACLLLKSSPAAKQLPVTTQTVTKHTAAAAA